jgi:hypothetical protein
MVVVGVISGVCLSFNGAVSAFIVAFVGRAETGKGVAIVKADSNKVRIILSLVAVCSFYI